MNELLKNELRYLRIDTYTKMARHNLKIMLRGDRFDRMSWNDKKLAIKKPIRKVINIDFTRCGGIHALMFSHELVNNVDKNLLVDCEGVYAGYKFSDLPDFLQYLITHQARESK